MNWMAQKSLIKCRVRESNFEPELQREPFGQASRSPLEFSFRPGGLVFAQPRCHLKNLKHALLLLSYVISL